MKREFSFTLWMAPDPRDLVDWSNELFEAGGDDTTAGETDGIPFVCFHREAESFEEALRSARSCLASIGFRVMKCEIEEKELVTWP